jgi:D-3-phosphoglycerate dehydrogenase / 2-oxoglutarate reductase
LYDKIYSIDTLPTGLALEINNRINPQQFSFITPLKDANWEYHKRQLIDTNILIHSATDITDDILDNAPKLKLIIKYEMRPGRVNIEQLLLRKIIYVKVPCMALISVAEFTVMMILVQAREFIKAYEGVKKETWLPELQPMLTTQTQYPYNWVKLEKSFSLARKIVGIIGMGIIGKSVARFLQPFGMKVVYSDIYRLPDEEEELLNVSFLPLDELFITSDFITVHLKHTEKTEGIIGEKEFNLMKPGAYFINTSRGRVIDEIALIDVLKRKAIAGAALDVYRYEPLPSDSPLRTLDNVILTPHIAGIPLDANSGMEADIFIDAIERYYSKTT